MRISDFIEYSNQAKDQQVLFRLIEEAGAEKGFDRIAYGALTNSSAYGIPEDSAPAVALNYPEDWRKYYFTHGYPKIDPVVCYTPSIWRPFTWSQLERIVSLTRAQKEVLELGREAGLNDGVSVPIHGPFGNVSVVCFASSDAGTDPESHLGHLQAIAMQFHITFMGLLQQGIQKKPPVELTERERECLLWSARGKSSWDMSIILGISESTVNFHIHNAMEKLGENTRIVTVMKAIHLGLIVP